MVAQNHQYGDNLKRLLEENEDRLMKRILDYAVQYGYAAYTSTLQEAWRLSIAGLTGSIIEGLQKYNNIPELIPEEELEEYPVAMFGIVEAERHRERGVSLNMFLGLMKYYRQSYIDLIRDEILDLMLRESYELFVNRVFDRIEIAFCVEWSGSKGDKAIHDLQISNRMMTNEKNKYLTIFESIPNPVIILNWAKKIDNMNFAAAKLFKKNISPGSQYYCLNRDRQLEMEQRLDAESAVDPSCFGGMGSAELLPWLEGRIDAYLADNLDTVVFEEEVHRSDELYCYQIKISKLLDVSGKFDGIIIILEDITSLKQALNEIKTLRGILPICSYCKNIRDDNGYWQRVEEYLEDRSEAEFSHSICPECFRKLYPDYDIDVK